MFALEEQIEREIIVALKQKDDFVVGTLRMIKAAIKNERIALGKNFTEADVVKIIRRELKKRLEAAEIYKTGQREDLAAQEIKEAQKIKQLLPQEMSDEQLISAVKTAMAEGNFSQMADFGLAMKAVMAKLAGQADGNQVSKLVKEQLSGGVT